MSSSLVDGADGGAALGVSLRADPKALPNPGPKRPTAPVRGVSSAPSSLAFGSGLNELCSLNAPPRPERPVDGCEGGNAVSEDEDDKGPPEPNAGPVDGFPKRLPPLGPPSPPKAGFEAKLAKPPVDVAEELEGPPKPLLLAETPRAPKPLVWPNAGVVEAVMPAVPEPHGEDFAPRPEAIPKADGWPNAGVADGAAPPNVPEPKVLEPKPEPAVPPDIVAGVGDDAQGEPVAPRADAPPKAEVVAAGAAKAAGNVCAGAAALGAGDMDVEGATMPGNLVPVLIESE
jgi:hypothetical protein